MQSPNSSSRLLPLLTLLTILLFGFPALGQVQEKLYYDAEWKPVSKAASAAYFRLITLDKDGRPVGKVRDYYITGEMQWEGTLTYFDRTDDHNNVHEGKCTWYYKSGQKSSEVSYINGKREGLAMRWHENGAVSDEIEYSKGQLNGAWISYYESGKVESKYEFKDGKLLGKWFTECDEFEKCQNVFRELFRDNENEYGWKLTSNSSIVPEKGILVKADSQRGSFQYVHLPIDITKSFSIETTINFTNGDANSGNGLAYGFKDWDNYYYFQVSPDGYYQVGAVREGLRLDLVKWTRSEHIVQSYGRNRLQVTKVGDKIFFAINRHIVNSLEFYRFAGNLVGFLTMPADKQLYYEKLEVRQDIDGVQIPTRNSRSAWKGSGSGVIFDARGFIATNHHVIDGASEIVVELVRGGRRTSYKAKVLVSDKQNDLSIVRIDDATFQPFAPIPFAVSNQASDVGTEVFALGYPAIMLLGDELKFTDGKISSKTGFQGDITSYQISVPLQPGNSGGPLFNGEGNLVGIVSSKVPILENVSYAIKIGYLSNLVDVVTERPQLPRQNLISSKPLTEKIKAISDYVVLIRIR